DLGMRFYALIPTFNAKTQAAAFNPAEYDRTLQPVLIQPFLDAGGVRVGRDPITGELYPAVKIGSCSPAGRGTANQGMTIYDEGAAIMKPPPIQLAPRFGFSWDVFGNARTALRSGFGMYYDRFPDDQIAQLAASPPLANTPSANYTTISSLLSSQLSLS